MISNYALQQMGYEMITPERPLAACFTSFSIYEVAGIIINDDSARQATSSICGHSYSIAIGKSINAVCRAIANDDFTPDEPGWCEQNGVKGPFLALSIGPTVMHSIEEGHVKVGSEGDLVTIDSFRAAKNELRGLEQIISAPVLAAAIAVFRVNFDSFNLRQIFSTFVGRTDSGRKLEDLRFSMTGTLEVRRTVSEKDILDGLNGIATVAPSIESRTSMFFTLGFKESDETKRFLYFFLSLEININTAFKHYRGVARGPKTLNEIRHCARLARTAASYDHRQKVDWRDLTARLTYLIIHRWNALGDGDLDEFKMLKSFRNDIAHGDLTEAPAGAARRAEMLAVKFVTLPSP